MRKVRKGFPDKGFPDIKDIKEQVKGRKGWIPPSIYKEITKRIPILCVELIIYNKDGKVLLLKRKLPPLQGSWWLPGSGVRLDEKLEKAAVRVAAEELGLKAGDLRLIRQTGIMQMFFRRGYFENPCHTVSIVFLMMLEGEREIRLDFQSADYKWTSDIPKHLTHYFVDIPELSFLKLSSS